VPLRVELNNPALLTWARERARLEIEDLTARFPRLPEWERGERHPTFKQLESFARATHAPIGFLLLDAPPEETTAPAGCKRAASVCLRGGAIACILSARPLFVLPANRIFSMQEVAGGSRVGRVAMQKVVGSSPIIRLQNPRKSGVFVLLVDNVSPG
jgi:hypothetical protein